MSQQPNNNEMFKADAAEVEQSSVSEQVEQAYIDYAMSVIGGRALPDVRDGLKPVQRRVLYKMYDLGVTSNKSHRKSSSIIGETMGDLHPHGDKAIYDALVRMSQDFSLGVPLVDGQGNFGSMDGDPPAAMRYTEARMSPISEDMMSDIDKDTVDFNSNYDNRLEEPSVLPASVPNLLINGASGIAVGMTTDIQPHNVGEVIDATIHKMKNPDCDFSDIMEYIEGPDFPTGAKIIGREGIRKAYKEGKGRITIRAKHKIEEDENRIIVTEIPYQKKKSSLVEKIADKINDGTLKELKDVRDESDRNGVRIVIEVKSTANIDVAENKLIESVLEQTMTMNHIALVDGQPKKLNIKQILDHYINHRRDVVRRRSEYELEEAEDRHHIVEGRLKALNDIDDIVETIRNSQSRKDAVQSLIDEYDFSKEQSDHITRMQLSSITGLKQEELKDEKDELESTIEELKEILNSEEELDNKIIEELNEMKSVHNHKRRTEIKEDYQSLNNEDLIPQEDIVVVLTDNNYIKRMPVNEFNTQNRGGKGVFGLYDDKDKIKKINVINTHDEILFFTSNGDVHNMKGYEIPQGSRQAHGTNIINLINIDNDENIESLETKTDIDNGYITIITEKGQVKRTDLDEFDNIWNPGLRCIELPDDDNIVECFVTNGETDLMIATNKGQIIRFNESEVRSTGRSSYGVRGIELEDNDYVSDATYITDDDDTVLTITDRGTGKLTDESEYRQQSRNGKGIQAMRNPDGDIVTVTRIPDLSENSTVLISSRDGKIVRIHTDNISKYGRSANGVNIMSLEENDRVTSLDYFVSE